MMQQARRASGLLVAVMLTACNQLAEQPSDATRSPPTAHGTAPESAPSPTAVSPLADLILEKRQVAVGASLAAPALQRLAGGPADRERYAEIRAVMLQGKPIRLEEQIYWPGGLLAGQYRMCRVPGAHPDSQRDIDDIPLPERANGVVHILTTQFGLPRDDLIRETARLFGVQRVTPRVKSALDSAIDLALQRAEARADGDRIVIG